MRRRLTVAASLVLFAGANAIAQTPPCSGAKTVNALGVTGCEQLDKLFTNFSLTNNNAPNGNQITTLFAGASPTTGVSASFLSANWSAFDFGSPVTRQSIISFDVRVDPAFTPPPYPNDMWSITSLSLSEVGALASLGAGPGNHVQIFEYFCAGSASFDCNSTSGNYGYIEYEQDGGKPLFGAPVTTTSTCFNNGSTSCAVVNGSLSLNLASFGSIFPEGVPQIAVQDVITLTAPNFLNLASLTSIRNTFVESAEAPEPGTLAMLGFAFAGFAGLRLRRRRQA